ncbi:MAG: hypothetical protein QF862_05860, partial [Prochlorococcaceae cyanobacterium ETNP7_MAG_30]|nr:hypothetical protein [Prochlorococcaceae cyanobacterium ETNP7_MAG_30]
MAACTELADEDWIPASFNQGWTYSQHIAAVDSGRGLLELLASSYTHSSRHKWQQRLQAAKERLETERREAEAQQQCKLDERARGEQESGQRRRGR